MERWRSCPRSPQPVARPGASRDAPEGRGRAAAAVGPRGQRGVALRGEVYTFSRAGVHFALICTPE